MILWLWTALLSGMILFPLYEPGVTVFIPVGVVGMAVALYTWFHPGSTQRRGRAAPCPGGVVKWRFSQGDAIVFAVSDGRSAAS